MGGGVVFFWWYYERRLAYTSRSSLLAEAKRLAKQAINVSDKVKDEKDEYPDYDENDFKKKLNICNCRYWIKYNGWKYRNEPLVLLD